jgi:hypothetical protein
MAKVLFSSTPCLKWHTLRQVIGYLILVLGGCSAPAPPSQGSYPEQLTAARAFKDAEFQDSSDSPVPLSRRETLLPLSYFPPALRYRVPASLQIDNKQVEFEIPTSTGKRRTMRRVGILEFTLKGNPSNLSAFVEANSNDRENLFVPFGDLTNGTETYPAGRYLDLSLTSTGIYDLDFNLAYHPFCYYDERYDCPYPPPENQLKTPVRAGERLPKN